MSETEEARGEKTESCCLVSPEFQPDEQRLPKLTQTQQLEPTLVTLSPGIRFITIPIMHQ